MPPQYLKHCPRCRTAAPLPAERCGDCGHRFRTRFRKRCPACTTPAELEAVSCARCGHVYRTPFAPPRPQRPSPLSAAPPETPPLVAPEPEPPPEPPLAPPGILSQIYTPNPWLDLAPGRPPYFAAVDLPVLERYQEIADEDRRFDGGIPPDPFLGDPQAPILLLDENPRRPARFRGDPADPDLAQRWTANLCHAPLAYPFFPMDPLIGERYGYGPLASGFGAWVREYGVERLARAFFRICFYPYASRRLPSLAEPLPSHAYALELARTKVRSGCLTIMLGGFERWEALIPDLKQTGHRVLRPGLRSLAPPGDRFKGNMTPEAAEAIRRALEALSDAGPQGTG